MEKSNITIKSNIFPRNGPITSDMNFISQLRGRHILEKIYNRTDIIRENLSDVQFKQLENGSLQCTLNDVGDITYGLILRNNRLIEVCKCEKFSCKNFKDCRSDVDENELRRIKEKSLNHSNQYLNENPKVSIVDVIIGSPLKPNDSNEVSVSKALALTAVKKEEFNNRNEAQRQTASTVNTLENTNVTETSYPIQEINIENSDTKKGDKCSKVLNPKLQSIEVQQSIIEAGSDLKILVNSGPGTGKTHTLLNRLQNLVDDQGLDVSEILVLSFSRAAIAEINQRLKADNVRNDYNYNILDELEIRTFDSFSTYVLKEVEPEISLKGHNYEQRIEKVINCLNGKPDLLKNFKHLIIDEIQDLVGVRARLVQTITKNMDCGFTFFGDPCQAIYDYQIIDSVEINSSQFYKWIQTSFENELQVYYFDFNHRQTSSLAEIGHKLRQSILHDGVNQQKLELSNALETIGSLGFSHNLTEKISFDRKKTYSILCRSNSQALRVSKHLRDQGVPHSLQKPATQRFLPTWLGEILANFEQRVISFNDFCRYYNLIVLNSTEGQAKSQWDLLKGFENLRGASINIIELKKNLIKRRHDWDKFDKLFSNVIVSSIHRSKGREFDSVILLEDSIKYFVEKNQSENDEEEIKTYYVGLTRPRTDVLKTDLKSYDKSIQLKTPSQRWVTSAKGRNKKRYLKTVEVGCEGDVDPLGFVDLNFHCGAESVRDIQKYIIENINLGDMVVLRKEIREGKVQYSICHQEMCIGYMSNIFVREIFEGLELVQNFYSSEDPNYYPTAIMDVYVEEKCTYLLPEDNIGIAVPNRQSGFCNGVYLSGPGLIKWNSDY